MRAFSFALVCVSFVCGSLVAQTPPPSAGTAASVVELRILDAGGEPVLSARVTPVVFHGEGLNLGVIAGHSTRDLAAADFAAGSANLAGLPEGRFALAVEAPGHALTLSESFALPSASPVRRAVRLRAGCVLEGRVLTPDGKPLADALVRSGRPDRLRNENPFFQIVDAQTFCTLTFASTRTGADGSYRLEHVAPGDYDLVAEHDAFAASKLRVKVGDQRAQKVDALSMQEGRVLTGHVTRRGKAVPGAVVVLSILPAVPKDGVTTLQSLSQVYVEVRADDAGMFRFARLPFGEYELSAGDATNPFERAQQQAASKRSITVKAGGNATELVEDLDLPRKSSS